MRIITLNNVKGSLFLVLKEEVRAGMNGFILLEVFLQGKLVKDHPDNREGFWVPADNFAEYATL